MIPQLRPAQIADWLAKHATQRPVVLDVREPIETQIAPVRADGFELIAMPMNQIPARIGELDPQRPVACLCHHGVRSQRVAMFLEQNGFADVTNVAGGVAAWSDERDPLVPRY